MLKVRYDFSFFLYREMNDGIWCYTKYDQGGVIMDVINPEQV